MICDDGLVPRRLLRLLSALALACAGLVLTGVPAQAACSCAGDVTVAQDAKRADVVFTGVLRDQERQGKRRVLSVDVERIYQGRVAETPVEVTSALRNPCRLGALDLDRGYVFFATGSSGTSLETARCTGTRRATPAYVKDVEQILGPGNQIPQPPGPEPSAPEPEFTRVADAEPTPFTRLAAPGGAMVLVGLLGLLLFRKRA